MNKLRVLLIFWHGLGDCVQLTMVLRVLAVMRPDWEIHVLTRGGKKSLFYGLCHDSYDEQEVRPVDFDHVFDLGWWECYTYYHGLPCTKAVNCLVEVFGIRPEADQCRYSIEISEQARRMATAYIEEVGRGRPTMLIHYEGNTSGEKKNLHASVALSACRWAIDNGIVPVILDWDHRSRIPDQMTIFNPGRGHWLWQGSGSGDPQTLAALIDAADLFVGIDSGPLHVAGATRTPSIGVWTLHPPIQFFDLADNVTHLVPQCFHELSHVASLSADFFRAYYYHREYTDLRRDLIDQLRIMANDHLDIRMQTSQEEWRMLRSTKYTFDYYNEHRQAGLDYLGFGDWQIQYGRWFVESLSLAGSRVLDVGCACGSILRGLGEAGAIVNGVDISEDMVRIGKQHWTDMQPIMHCCDAVNLHLFDDASWDAIHCAQVAEHFRPDHVPLILRELHRVTAPGGLFFCSLDTQELYDRQHRDPQFEDPTHICVRPMAWWHEQLRAAGWELVEGTTLVNHPNSYIRKYDWDWWLAVKT